MQRYNFFSNYWRFFPFFYKKNIYTIVIQQFKKLFKVNIQLGNDFCPVVFCINSHAVSSDYQHITIFIVFIFVSVQ